MRKIGFEIGKYYHVFNRGAGKSDIFFDEIDFLRFLKGMREFNNEMTYEERKFIKNKIENSSRERIKKTFFELEKEKEEKWPSPEASGLGHFSSFSFKEHLDLCPKLVGVICYCLINNHYHLILEQLVENGVYKFMHKLGTGYSGYFNSKYDRKGVLFERNFEAYPINSEGRLWWLSAYVNCNYEIHKLGSRYNWIWSSFSDYIGKRNGDLCNKNLVLANFPNTREYDKFCDYVVKEAKDIKKVKKFLMN